MASRALLTGLARAARANANAAPALRHQGAACAASVQLRPSSSASGAAKPNPFPESMRRWMFNASGFNQYGLYHDDLLKETEDVKEALRRIPPKLLVRQRLLDQVLLTLAVK